MDTFALLFAAGCMAGFANALAGGGALLVFPAMLAAGLPPTVANASTALAVWPGHAAAVPAALPALRPLGRRLLLHLGLGALGAAAGAALLLATGDRLLRGLVPWLLLAATLLLAAAPWLRLQAERRAAQRGGVPGRGPGAMVAELGCAVYGGYFGAGLGVMLMALYEATGASGGDPRIANALKNLVASAVTAIAIAGFVVADVIAWQPALTALAGAIAGGWLGGRAIQRASPAIVRRVVLGAAALLTAREFWVAWVR
jgi:uncharacterized membrane protein YfcA